LPRLDREGYEPFLPPRCLIYAANVAALASLTRRRAVRQTSVAFGVGKLNLRRALPCSVATCTRASSPNCPHTKRWHSPTACGNIVDLVNGVAVSAPRTLSCTRRYPGGTAGLWLACAADGRARCAGAGTRHMDAAANALKYIRHGLVSVTFNESGGYRRLARRRTRACASVCMAAARMVSRAVLSARTSAWRVNDAGHQNIGWRRALAPGACGAALLRGA